MDFGDAGFHFLMDPSSSVLQELSNLTPPSPILSPVSSQLSTSWTSGDVPIILFQSGSGFAVDFSLPDIPDDVQPAISSSDSGESVGTVGTFGPRRRDRKSPLQFVTTTARNSSNYSVYTTPPVSPARTALNDNDSCSISEKSCANFHTALSTVDSGSSLCSVGEAQYVKVDDGAGSAVLNSHPSHLTLGPRSPFYAQFTTSTSTRSISSCSPSPYSYTCPKPWQEDYARSLKAYPSSESLAPYTSVPRTPPSLYSSSSQLSLNRQPHVHRSSNHRDPAKPELPESLSWLKDVNIGLLIDQEGFRAVHPSFRFVGYSPYTRSLDPQGGAIEGGVAEFMPIKRQAFNFHYALFDGLPILRRVTVNGEEDRDYISRQATLSLKTNGVYTIRGSETSSHASHQGDSPGAHKLRWKFDYMVDCRRQGEGSGRVLDGEKTLTPLTFSCSPLLLDPSQGKKIRLMHIVKKSVVTKLVAEKVEPTPSGRISAPSSPTISSGPNTNSPKTHPGISRVWNVHRRAQSQVPTPNMESEGLLHIPRSSRHFTSNIDANSDQNEENHLGRVIQRRRRASSAGEKKRRHADGYIQFGVPLTNVPLEEDVTSRLSSPATKHNMGPSRLSASLSLRVRTKLN